MTSKVATEEFSRGIWKRIKTHTSLWLDRNRKFSLFCVSFENLQTALRKLSLPFLDQNQTTKSLWPLDETNTVFQLILDLSKSKLRMRSQVWESLKKIGWKPVYFGHFDVQKKSFTFQILHFSPKIILLFTKIDFWSLNSIFIKSIFTNSVPNHPRHLNLFFCTSKCLNYPSFTGICDRSGSFWDLVANLLFESRCRFWRNLNATHHDPNPTAEHASLAGAETLPKLDERPNEIEKH